MELKTEYTVYRLYDAEDDLLYVGCTKHLTKRLEEHSKREWWPEAARIEETHFDSLSKAADAEERYYFAGAPRYNGKKHARYFVRGSKSKPGQRPRLKVVDGMKLKELRLDRGLSQMELHGLSGVSQDTISKLETGDRPNPHPRTLRALASALGVSVADIRKRTED